MTKSKESKELTREQMCEAIRFGDWHNYSCWRAAKRTVFAAEFTPKEFAAIGVGDRKLLQRPEGMRVCGLHDPERAIKRWREREEASIEREKKRNEEQRQARLDSMREHLYPKVTALLEEIARGEHADPKKRAAQAVKRMEAAMRYAENASFYWQPEEEKDGKKFDI